MAELGCSVDALVLVAPLPWEPSFEFEISVQDDTSGP